MNDQTKKEKVEEYKKLNIFVYITTTNIDKYKNLLHYEVSQNIQPGEITLEIGKVYEPAWISYRPDITLLLENGSKISKKSGGTLLDHNVKDFALMTVKKFGRKSRKNYFFLY